MQTANSSRPALVSLNDLATLWRLSRSTVRRALRRAGIRPYRVGGGLNSTLRYDAEEVARWFEQQRERI